MSLFSNIVNLGRKIVLSKLIEAVVKELLVVLYNVKSSVLSTVDRASVIAEPDIVSSLS